MKSKIEKVCSLKNKKIVVAAIGVFLLGVLSGWVINDNSHMKNIQKGVSELNNINSNSIDPAVNINFE